MTINTNTRKDSCAWHSSVTKLISKPESLEALYTLLECTASVHCLERQNKLPTMYWLPKLHKRPYKARFIANSSFCTKTELPKLLTSCLTAVKSRVTMYYETVYERSRKNRFWSIIHSGKILSKQKSRSLRATSLSTYNFSTHYTTLPHNLIKEKDFSI